MFEIKNQITQEYVDKFLSFVRSDEFFHYFDFYTGKKLIPVMGSISLKEHQVKMLTDANILALSIRGDFLTFKNYSDVQL